MSLNANTRENQIKKLREFISTSRKKILAITSELQWDPKSLIRKKEMVVCPLDEGHIIPKESLTHHVEKCKLKKGEYHPEDTPFPPLSVEPDSSTVLKVDSKLQASILRQAKEKKPNMLIGFPGEEDDREVPLSSDRFMSSLTSDEKSALHSYVISNTVSPGEGKDISLAEQDLEINFKNKKEPKKDKTPLEKLIEERDAKRRKEGKKVHINRKSHTEIIREVIENQMEIYVEWLRDENLLNLDESEAIKVETLSTQSQEEDNKLPERDEENSASSSKDYPKPFVMYNRRERFKDSWHHKDRRKDVDYADGRWQSERELEQSSRSYNFREEGSKRHRDYESVRHREYESRHYKERFYDKHGNRHRTEESRDEYEKVKVSKYSECQKWSDGDYMPKEEFDERDMDGGLKKNHDYSRENKKQEKERKHHKSKRRHRSSDSEGDCGSKRKKKKKHHKRDD